MSFPVQVQQLHYLFDIPWTILSLSTLFDTLEETFARNIFAAYMSCKNLRIFSPTTKYRGLLRFLVIVSFQLELAVEMSASQESVGLR